MEILEQIEKNSSIVEEIRNRLPIIQKIPLVTGLEGYNLPKAYGIYKQTGGNCLGVSRESYRPVDLSLFLDTIVNSCTESNLDIDLNKIEYKEYKEGQKVAFRVPLKDFEVKTPMVGDIIKCSLLFTTGFDAKTKSSLTYSTYRLWCKNGAGRWDNGYSISFKNTKNSIEKHLLFTEQIIKTSEDVENYVKNLEEFAKKPITQEQIDDFYFRLTGVNKKNYEYSHGKSKKIFDSLQNAFLIESQNTGVNAFSLLQAATRYSTHELAEVTEDLYFGNAADFNQRAHQLVYQLN